MEILFLGTGSCMPSTKMPTRSYSGFFIDNGDESFLFDIGPGAIHKLVLSGVDILDKPTHIFITHLHPDHTLDLITLIQARDAGFRRINKAAKINLYGPIGTKKLLNSIINIKEWGFIADSLKKEGILEIREVSSGEIAKGKDWKVKSNRIKHFENSVAYSLEIKGSKIVYSGDMGYDEKISELGKDADVAILECSVLTKKGAGENHLCPEDIGKLAKLGSFKKIILTHMYPECEGHEDGIISTINKETDAQVVLACDLMKVGI